MKPLQQQEIARQIEGQLNALESGFSEEEVMIGKALRIAINAVLEGGHGVGAIIKSGSETLVTAGNTGSNGRPDAFIAHAEISALVKLNEAGLRDDRPKMFTTLEPCGMCTRAILIANSISEIIVGALEPRSASILSQREPLLEPRFAEMLSDREISFRSTFTEKFSKYLQE